MKPSFLATVLALSVFASSAAADSETIVAPAASSSAAAICEAREQLDEIDGRRPVPLLPQMADHQKRNMRDHLLAVQEIVTALVADDFDAIGTAASRIGSSDQMKRMCTHMGAGAAGFTDLALRFHETADTIAAAAAARDRAAVTKALSETLSTCNACHATFRQHVVDETTWSQATSMTPPPGPGSRAGRRGGAGPHGPPWSGR